MVFITMEQTLKILKKLLDNFIIPKFEDIVEYGLKHQKDINGDKVKIDFIMDGTEEEIEEEIVYECYNLLKYYDLPNLKLSITFTTDGENFYVYN